MITKNGIKPLIVVGGVYYDGKWGVREVVGRHESVYPSAPSDIVYRVLAAKVERKTVYIDGQHQTISTIGLTEHCSRESFTRWAQRSVAQDEQEGLLADLAAMRLKLTPNEMTLLNRVRQEFCGDFLKPIAGSSVSFDISEIRCVRGAAKKGLVSEWSSANNPTRQGRILLTELGAAWIRTHPLEALDEANQNTDGPTP